MRFFTSFFIFLIGFFAVADADAQAYQLSPDAKVSVITCGLGNEMYSLFGHTAVRISDPVHNLDMVYNYGAFDFETPNFVLRFSKGDLQYFVTADRFQDFLYNYNYEQRTVLEQELNMTAAQKQALFDEFNVTLVSEKRFYTYKFIDRNCTTMVVDILNRTLGQNVIRKTDATEQTYREVLFPYFDNHFYEQLGTSIIFGSKVDRQADKIFLPIELWKSVNTAQNGRLPLLKAQKTWFEFPVPETTDRWWNNPYTYVGILLLIVVANSRIITAGYFVFAGAIGLFFSVAGLYSYHGELAWNYNALLLNPVLLLLAYFIIRRNVKAQYVTSLIVIAGILIYLLLMLTKIHLVIVLPIIIAHLVICGRIVYRYRFARKMNK